MTPLMSADSTVRLEVAAEIARLFTVDPAVSAVLCAGSTGRGHADRWSDLEIGVFWSRPPGEDARRRVAEQLGGDHLVLYGHHSDERAWFDDWWVHGPAGRGLLVEVCHVTDEDASALLDRLLVNLEPTPYLLTYAAALAYGRVLTGSVRRLADRVATYPRPLAAAVTRQHGQLDHFWRWRMYVDRGDPHGLRTHFAGVVTAITHVVCALNGRWWPGPKWPTRTLADLPTAPPRLAARLAEVDALPPERAAAALTGLVSETYDLVESHLPEVDTDRLRAIFAFGREPWPPG